MSGVGSMEPILCDGSEFERLAGALGETPETVIPVGMLLSGECVAYRVGLIEQPLAIAVQGHAMPEEPMLFGTTAEAVAALLPAMEGWTCVNIAKRFASQLSALVELVAEASSVRQLDDVYYQLEQLAEMPVMPGVRLLSVDDGELLRNSPLEMAREQADSILEKVEQGYVGAAIVDGAVVALAHTFMQSRRFADLGVVTHEAYRGRGYAKAVGHVVCEAVLKDGKQPVWSCGETNVASRKVAERLGFREISRRVYLVPQFG